MTDVVYRAEARIERVRGPLRLAYLPAEKDPVAFGVHGAIARHYKVSPAVSDPHATTIDYLVAATGGWLVGTFGGALEARQIDAGDGRLVGDVTGEVEAEQGVLVVRRIHVAYTLRAAESDRETIERVHAVHHRQCPIYRSICAAIEVTTGYEITGDA